MRPLTYRLDASELEVWVREVGAARQASTGGSSFLDTPYFYFGMATVICVMLTGVSDDGRERFPLMFAATMLPLMAFWSLGLWHTRRKRAAWCRKAAADPVYAGPFTLTLDAEMLRQENAVQTRLIRRDAIRKVDEKNGLLLLSYGSDQVIVLPVRAFDGKGEKAAFIGEFPRRR